MKLTIAALALTAVMTDARASSGHAKAEWIAESASFKPGTIRTVIKLTLEEGWHTYWVNPGEGGMPVSVNWELPEGWSAGEIQHPAPIRFMTGDLPGFGYEGVVLFPVDITGPHAMRGNVTLSGKVSWLTCNDSSCVPGSAEVSLNFSAGGTDGDATANKELIEKAYAAIPREAPGADLKVETKDETVIMSLTLPVDSKLDPSAFEVFPATRNVIDPAAKLNFIRTRGNVNIWTATAPKSEYLDGEPDSLSLVLAAGKETPWVVSTGK